MHNMSINWQANNIVCDSLKIDYFKSGYFTIEGKLSIIDFSDPNNNDDGYVR